MTREEAIAELVACGAWKRPYRAWSIRRNEALRMAIKALKQPETTIMTVGKSKGGITLWYECKACGEPVDAKDIYCSNCGRRFEKEGQDDCSSGVQDQN